MKFLTHFQRGSWGWGRSVAFPAGWAAGLSACLLGALPVLGGTLAGGGDEGIGSLPAIGRSNFHLRVIRNGRGTQSSLYLEGTPADLSIVILGARGDGFASVEALDPGAERVRLAFHGDVVVALDRDLATGLPIGFGVAVPENAGASRATLTWGGSARRVVRVSPGLLVLPVSSMSAEGTLDAGPLQVIVAGGPRRRTVHTIVAAPDVLILRQGVGD